MSSAAVYTMCVCQFEVQVLDRNMADLWHYMPEKVAVDVSNKVIAPMPGIVKSVAVQQGQMVSIHVEFFIFFLLFFHQLNIIICIFHKPLTMFWNLSVYPNSSLFTTTYMLSVFSLNLLIKFVPPVVCSNGCIQLIVGR